MTDQAPTAARPSAPLLLVMLAGIVMFEGFDVSATSVVLPYIARDFGADTAGLGNALALIALGSIAAWVLLRMADRFGRRPLLLISAAGFSLGSLATAFSDSVGSYTAVQFVTRALLVTQIAMAYMIVSETLPAHWRGRANGLLGAMGSFGAALPFLAIEPAMGHPLGWRLLFVIGAAPLLLMPLLLWKLRETPVWLAARAQGAVHSSVLGELRALTAPGMRRRFVAMSALWLIVNFTSATSALFFTLYVVKERGWPPSDFALLAPFGLTGAFVGYLGAGLLADAIGRRWTMALFMALLGGLTMLCYGATSWHLIAAGFIGLQAMLGVWVVAFTLNSELFPTALRGAANGWCNNLIGRWGVVVAPILLGQLSTAFGSIAKAASLLGIVAWLAVPVILLLLPETRGRNLYAQDAPPA
jgi:MFS family permease